MLDRPSPDDAALDGTLPGQHPRWPSALMGLAGLMGAAGVLVAAAGSHIGGGDLARTSSEFLMIHAVAVIAAGAVALGRPSALLGIAMGLLTVGAILFGGELALAGLADWRPLPLAAPTGGMCLIAGWLALSMACVTLASKRP